MDSPTDATLARYLLGDLPPGEVEQLDERGVVDAVFAERLRSAEHDLADAYARGELSADDRRRWERTFGASAAGRDQLRLAQALAARERRAAPLRGEFGRKPKRRTPGMPLLGLAAAAVLALAVAIGYSVHWNGDGTSSVATSVPPQNPPAAAANAPSAPRQRTMIAIMLPAPTRSAAQPPTLVVTTGTDDVRAELRLAPDDFTAYTVDLRDLSSQRIAWSSQELAPAERAGERVLLCTVPADVLHAGRFAFELRGVAPRRSEVLGSYPLLVER